MRKGLDVPALLRYDLAVAEFAYLASISVTVHSAVLVEGPIRGICVRSFHSDYVTQAGARSLDRSPTRVGPGTLP